MLLRGDRQSDIAAFFSENGGRIAEINTGQKWKEVVAARAETLPPPGPYLMGPRSAIKARQTLEAMRDLIVDVLDEMDRWERKDDQS